jgi:hypothetical protein
MQLYQQQVDIKASEVCKMTKNVFAKNVYLTLKYTSFHLLSTWSSP